MTARERLRADRPPFDGEGRIRSLEQVALIPEAWLIEFFAGLKGSERDLLNDVLGLLRGNLAQTLDRAPPSIPRAMPAKKTRAPRRDQAG